MLLRTTRPQIGKIKAKGKPVISAELREKRAQERRLADGREQLAAAIKRVETRLRTRAQKVTNDLRRGEVLDEEAARAVLFLAEAARAPRGATALAATDWSTGEPVTREMPLDPAKSAKEQVDAVFAKARRMKQGRAKGEARLAESEAKRARLTALREAVEKATSLEELATLALEGRQADATLVVPPNVAGGAASDRPAPRVPYRTFRSTSGARILVGKGGSKNDELLTDVAKPFDLWLRAGVQRALHVIVPLAKGKEVSGDVLIDAAHLAAHFSGLRGKSDAEVRYAPCKYVRKPKGSATGAVLVERDKALAVRIDAARVTALLAREEGK